MSQAKKIQAAEELDSSPVTVVDTQSLQERFPEGAMLTLNQITDFSNVGEQRPVYLDGKRQYDENNRPVFEEQYRYGVYDTDGTSVIGYFKYSMPSLSWTMIRVLTHHYTADDGTAYLYFKVMNKLDKVTDVQSYITGRNLLAELKEEL